MDPIERARLRIAEVIAGSAIAEDPRHSRNALEWLLRLDPDADAALQLAALGHDIDRAVAERKVLRADFDDYDAFKSAHARNSRMETRRRCLWGYARLSPRAQSIVARLRQPNEELTVLMDEVISRSSPSPRRSATPGPAIERLPVE